LQEIEEAVVTYEEIGSLSLAAEEVRPEAMSPELKDPISLAASMRWLKRRVEMVYVSLLAVMGLFPEEFKGCQVCLLRPEETSWDRNRAGASS
jgi:hypothetical protein